MLTKQIVLILLLSLSVTTTPVFAKVYKWTDSKGNVHYTSTPPPTKSKVKEFKEVKIQKTAESSLTYKEDTYQAPIETAKKSATDKENKSQRKKAMEDDKEECLQASEAEKTEVIKGWEKLGQAAVAAGRTSEEKYEEIIGDIRHSIRTCEKLNWK